MNRRLRTGFGSGRRVCGTSVSVAFGYALAMLPAVLSIGNFDGVHIGHRAILARAKEVARGVGARVVAMTFDPSPAHLLRPGSEPPRLMSLSQRIASLKQTGADEVRVIAPTAAFLSHSPQQFVAELMATERPLAVVEGHNFRFGKDRAGDTATLRQLGAEHSFAVHVVEPVEVVLQDLMVLPVSSTLVRWLTVRGRMGDVARCLGQPYAIESRVVRGEQRGRTLGVPTVNLDDAAWVDRALPADGVYAGRALLSNATEAPAAISIGLKPTFAGRKRVIESHLLDFTGDLYDQTITLQWTHWLRDQQTFPNLETLASQLQRDIAHVRELE